MCTANLQVPTTSRPKCVWDHDFVAFLAEGDDPYRAGARLHEREGPGLIWATNASRGLPSWIFVSTPR